MIPKIFLLLSLFLVVSCTKEEDIPDDVIVVGIDYDHKITSGYGD